MGMCVAGGAYLPVMTDTVLMTEGSGLFLAGPALVQAAIGQKTPPEELGGAAMHAEISGTVDFKEANDELCLKRLRSLVDKMGAPQRAPFSVTNYDPAVDAPIFAAEDLYGLLDPAPGASNVYDMREVIARIVDRSEFDEYKEDFGRTRDLRVCADRRAGRGDCRESEDEPDTDGGDGAAGGDEAHRVGRRDLHGGRAEGGAVHHGLQPEAGAADFSA